MRWWTLQLSPVLSAAGVLPELAHAAILGGDLATALLEHAGRVPGVPVAARA